MQTAVNATRYMLTNLKCNIKCCMAYKFNFISQTIMMFINNSTFLVFWGVIFGANGGSIDGVVMADIMYLWAASTIPYGITYFLFGGVRDINEYLITGGMDTYLVQPKHPLLGILTSKCVFSACGDLIYGIVMALIASRFDIVKTLWCIVIGVSGTVVYLACEIILRSLAVFLGNTDVIAEKYLHTLLTKFSTYPENIFGGVTKFLLYTVIPSAYISYVPLRLIIDFNLKTLALYIIALIICATLSITTFNIAISKYESGNNIAMRN